jgi:Tol biopolymer transport system component
MKRLATAHLTRIVMTIVIGVFLTSQMVVAQAEGIIATAWSPDGTKLAYGGNDGTLQIVSVADVEIPTADTAQSYAYITQLESGDAQIHRINPLDPNMTLPLIPIGIPADHRVFQAIASPDGKWIAMWVYWEGYFQLYVYEVSTSALYMAKQVHSLDLFDNRLITPVWSPNSQYLAFNIFDGTLYSTFLVTPTHREIVTIHSGSSDNALPLVYAIALAWSADTRYLAVVQSDCYNLLCTNNIRAYSVPDISELGVVKIQGTICEVQWSPDNHRISFAQACDDPNIFYSSDVYIWDIGMSKVDRLTDLSNNSSDSVWEQRYATVRAAIWFDPDTLLIGTASAKIGPNPKLIFAETATYQPSIGRVSSVSDEVITRWVRNKHSGEFAYYSASVHDVDEYWINFNLGSIKIAAFDGTKLSVIQQIDVPKNYDFRPLAWSLDERFVAFSTGDPKSYRFIDKTTGKTTEVSLPATYFITVGWIAQ